MIPASIRRQLVCTECVRLFVYLDETQRDRCAPVQGLEKVEEAMSWQTRTAKRHLLHLAGVGLVELRPEPKRGGGWSHIRFAVRHNPARSRYASLRTVPGVWETPRRRFTPDLDISPASANRDIEQAK